MVEGISITFIQMLYSRIYTVCPICRMTVRRGAGDRSASMASCSMP